MDGAGARNGSRQCGAKKTRGAGLLLATLALGMPLSAYGEGVSLEVRGLEEGRVLTNVRNTVPAPDMACDAPRARFQSYLLDAERRARSALQALGHFNALVETRVDVSTPCPKLVLVIEAGPAVRLDQVDIRIVGPFDEDPSGKPFFEDLRLRLRVGDELDQGAYDKTRDDLINRARARGFLDARFVERELWVDPERNIARVTLVLESGDLYHFGEIRADQRIFDPRFFDRLMPVSQGDPFTSDRLAMISSNLAATGYFADVRVRPDMDARSDEQVPVAVLLTERAQTAYEFRAGFGTDTGARLRADVDRRWVNRYGHRWRAGVGLSQRIQSIDTIYSMPQRNPLTDSLDVYARLQHEDNNAIQSNSGTIGGQYSRRLGDWSQALFTEYVYERTTFGNEPERASNFLLGGVRMGHRTLDDPLFPTRGHSFNVKLQAAAESLMSSASLTQANVKGALAYPFGRAILKASGEVGTTWTSDFTELPKSLRFFAGGDNSVRGYSFESLGPRNAGGEVVGGQHLVLLSFEAMYPVRGDDWFGAAFVDVGNAFDETSDMDLKTGAGVGVRWRSPIGMVRIDVAVPFDGSNRRPRLHLGIGAGF